MDQRKTVLLADASEEFRTLLREEIEKAGEFSVETARDGNEVLKRTEERTPDLLVMDAMLVGLDGISVLRQLQKRENPPMTILTSAFVSDRMLMRHRSWAWPISCRSPLKRRPCWIKCGAYSYRPEGIPSLTQDHGDLGDP